MVEAWADSLRQAAGTERSVGTAEAPIDARDAVSRRRESALGDLVTDAIRAGTGADVALLNAGAMRLDDVIPAGPISSYQLESIFLFADETRIVTFPLSGGRLREVLEHGVSDASLGKGGFLQVAGVEFTFDRTRALGQPAGGRPAAAAAGLPSAPRTRSGGDGGVPGLRRGRRLQDPGGGGELRRRRPAPRAADLLIRYLSDSLGGKVTVPASGRIVEAGAPIPAELAPSPLNSRVRVL